MKYCYKEVLGREVTIPKNLEKEFEKIVEETVNNEHELHHNIRNMLREEGKTHLIDDSIIRTQEILSHEIREK